MSELLEVAQELEMAGLLLNPTEVDGRCVCASATVSWGAIAEEASKSWGGQWWWSESGVTWLCGRRTGWMVSPARLPEVFMARRVCESLGVECGWSVGSAARALLKWVAPEGFYERSCERLIEGGRIGYHECTPSQYEYGQLHDVRACYYSLLCRLPSLRLSVLWGKQLWWHQTPVEEWARWTEVKARVAGAKMLRNSLVGCMMGRSEQTPFWHRGELRTLKGKRGHLRAGALLICRTAYELCRLAAQEVEADYANTDCVISGSGRFPSSWERFGLEVNLVAEGATEIYGRGIYKVGGKRTKWWDAGSRLALPVERAPMPEKVWASEWL